MAVQGTWTYTVINRADSGTIYRKEKYRCYDTVSMLTGGILANFVTANKQAYL